MRLFSLPSGAVDSGERSSWMTPPFDRNLRTFVVVIPTVPTWIIGLPDDAGLEPDPFNALVESL